MPLAPEQQLQDARSFTIPAPVGGWNTRDPLNEMDALCALQMDNWFPNERDVSIRKGFSPYTTSAIAGAWETLVEHRNESSVALLLGAGAGNIYSLATAVPSVLGTSFSEDRWQTLEMNNNTLFYNGTDQPQRWTGSNLIAATYTGIPDDNKLIQATSYRNRIYGVVKDSASVWYTSSPSAITGAMTEFPLQFVLRRGGCIEFVTNWTRNSGEYLSELLVIVSREGETLVYAGPSPDDASFTLVGHLLLDKPLGRRSYMQRGPELEILTETGPVPMSQALTIQNSRMFENALSANIAPTFVDVSNDYYSNEGWQMLAYPQGKYALINVPIVSGSNAHQYVRNLYTGAWARFTGQAAACWATYARGLYFGGFDGHVYQADSGRDDNGAQISTDLKTAYNYLGDRDAIKEMGLCRPILISDGSASFALQASMDFEERSATDTISLMPSTGSEWDSADWDLDNWSGAEVQSANWNSITGIGRAVSIRMKAAIANLSVRLAALNVLYKPGGRI